VTDHLLILSRIHLPATWTQASAHLIIDAGPEAIRKLGVEAGPNGENPSNQPEGLFERSRRRIRTEIDGIIFLDPSHNGERGKILLRGKLKTRIILIVSQLHVITGTMGFDQVVFKDEGFLLSVGDNGIDVGHILQHGQSLRILVLRLLEIGTYPMFDIAGLADIENRPFLIFEKVDPGMGREMIDFLF
jgi:hypothetical protein